MEGEYLGLIELLVVLLFGLGWGILELVTLRIDRRKARERARAEASGDSERSGG